MIWGRGCNSGDWWLRSPDDNNDNNAWVGVSSGGSPDNNNVDNNNLAVRPDFPRSQKRTGKCPSSVPRGKEPRSHPFQWNSKDKYILSEPWTLRLSQVIREDLGGRAAQPPAGGGDGGEMTDFEKICDFNNLYSAHKKARLGKRNKPDVIAFEMDLANNLWDIKERLESGRYTVSGYKRFMIYDPKEREIQALSYADRIVQHSLCDNVLTPFFERRLIYDNCACRVGKGTHFGMKRLEGFMRDHYKHCGPEGWILKADVRKFFQNIDHAVLLKRLREVIPDPKVMRLLEMIVDSFNVETGRGLPMGNQTSQLFALYYLDPIDRLVKEKLRVKHYTRYMDDHVLLHPDKSYLQECLRQMQDLAGHELQLCFNEKTHIFPMANGVDYLGWHFYLTDTGKVIKRLRVQNKKKLKRRLKGLRQGYADGRMQWADIKRSMAAIHGHLCHGHTYRLRAKLYNETIFIRRVEDDKNEQE